MGELLTIAETAKRAGMPESTARFYRDRHSQFIPVIGEGRGRRYPVEAVAVLRAIAEAARQGATPDMIDAALRSQFPMDASIQQQQSAGTQQENAAAIRAALSDVIRQAVREEVGEVMAELVQLRAEVQRLTVALGAGQQQEPQAPQDAPVSMVLTEPDAPPTVEASQPQRALSLRERLAAWFRGDR